MKSRLLLSHTLIILVLFSTCIYGQKKYSTADMDKFEGRIKLNLIDTWGDDDDDDHKIYKIPIEFKIDSQGNVYILDMGQVFIKKYKNSGEYICNIGKRGEGPGEYMRPSHMFLDREDNFHVAEYMRNYEFIYDQRGKFSHRIKVKGNLLAAFFLESGRRINLEMSTTGGLGYKIVERDRNQKLIREFLQVTCVKWGSSTWEELLCSLDKEGSIYAALKATPIIRKFSKEGKFLWEIQYEPPFKTCHKITEDKNKCKLKLMLSKSDMIVHGFCTDEHNRVYLVIKNKPINKEMKRIYSLISSTGGRIKTGRKATDEFDATDLFRLLVFNHLGDLINSKKMAVFCDQISIYKDHLYILDTYYSTHLYKYKINFN